MNEILNLLTEDSHRYVFCALRSIGTSEFYQAQATNMTPELKFVLSDYLDYHGELYAEYEGTIYRIMRTYRTGLQLELTVTRASAEEVEIYGKHAY